MSVYWAADIAAFAACMAVFTHRHAVAPALGRRLRHGLHFGRAEPALAGAGAVEALLPVALSWVGYSLAMALFADIAYRLFILWFRLSLPSPDFDSCDAKRRPAAPVTLW